jgi:biotin carboxylase
MASPNEFTALVLGGSHAEVPIIADLQERGLRVVTTGNQPQGLGHRFSDVYIPGDFSNWKEMEALAIECGANAMVPGCNDFAMISATRVAENLGFQGYDTVENCLAIHHKDSFRKLQETLGIPHPTYVMVRRDEGIVGDLLDVRFPVLVKPVDLTGGKGISICQTHEEIPEAIDRAFERTREKRLIIESFLPGSRHGITTLLLGQRVVFSFADDEQYFHDPFLVSGTTTPSSLTVEQYAQAVEFIEAIATKLRLVDGLLHAQVILSSDQLHIIEICRRCPGDLYPTFVEWSTGFSYTRNIVNPFLGLPIGILQENANRPVIRRCILARSNGTISGLAFQPPRSTVRFEVVNWRGVGDRVEDFLTEKLGITFFELQDQSDLARFRHSHESLVEAVIDV